ncbi:hypothetical protein SMD44_08305 [Streptomyces alboflavus]|uniref:Uncharacterized protein n=1 Tax=Streptomyces alboflavus TaxID=67267 RepID=A0A1Z1WQV0_9ACTN|nr:hypothetical protein SMD44_08305 [Streptomyces alboflavus]
MIGIRAGNSIDWLAWDLAALATGARLKAFGDTTEIDDRARSSPSTASPCSSRTSPCPPTRLPSSAPAALPHRAPRPPTPW